jgi:hypothetical protein
VGTVEQIENELYSQNDLADLMYRLQIATTALCFVADTIALSGITDDPFIKEAHAVALNSWGRIQSEHECDVLPQKDGSYKCACELIASAEIGKAG